VLKGKQGMVGAGYGQEDLVELALSRALMAYLSGLDSENRAEISIALLSAISAF
jgi:hypothetical protein